MQAPSLFFTEEDLARAKKRISSAAEPWKTIADNFFESAAKVAAKDFDLSDFDSSWFDSQPDKPFSDTYDEFHNYILPARELATDAATLAKAAVLGCDKAAEYKQLAIKLTQHVLDKLKTHVIHCDSGMNYRHTICGIADVYFLLNGELPETWLEKFFAQTKNIARAIIDCNDYWQKELAFMPYNNHLAFHRNGMLVCGICLKDDELIEKAFNGPGSPEHMLAGCVTDDGLCYESSTLYHYATYGAMHNFALVTRVFRPLGRNVFDEVYADGRSLKQMLDAPMGMLLPNGQRPSFGDCYASRPEFLSLQKGHYEIGSRLWKDPRYAWIINKTEGRGGVSALLYGPDEVPAGTQPEVGSRIWIEHGWAIASGRDSENYFDPTPDGFTVAINGDKSCVHNHRDKFTIQLVTGNHTWLDDAESRSTMVNGFSDPIKEQFCRSGWAHNMVIVNGAEQKSLTRPLNFIRYRNSDGECSISLADFDAKVYDDTQIIRSVVTTKDYCLDVVDLQSKNCRTMDWVIHPACDSSSLDSKLNSCDKPENCPSPALKDFKRMDVGGNSLAGSFSADAGELSLNLSVVADCDSETDTDLELYYASCPTITDDSTPRTPMYFVRSTGKDKLCFVALYQLAGETGWAVSGIKRIFNGSENELRINLKRGDEVKHYVLPGI